MRILEEFENDRAPTTIAFTSGKFMVTGHVDGKARIWNEASGKLAATLPADGKEVITEARQDAGDRQR